MRQAFIEAPIFNYFNLKHYICIETDVSNYIISKILSQLTLSQYHLVAYFSKKMILAETWYEIYDGELLAIVKLFKHYLKDYKYEVFIFIDHHNL